MTLDRLVVLFDEDDQGGRQPSERFEKAGRVVQFHFTVMTARTMETVTKVVMLDSVLVWGGREGGRVSGLGGTRCFLGGS